MSKKYRVSDNETERLEMAARNFGTPLYVYDGDFIRKRYRELDRGLDRLPHQVLYAVKSNSNLSVLRLLAKEGAGADVVSAGELARALRAGVPASRIVFSGTGKTREELVEASQSKLLLVGIEVEDEIPVLAAEGRRLGEPVRVAVRVNPDVDASTHPAITTGRAENKFGIPVHEAKRVYEAMQGEPGLSPAGISFHLGSQIQTPRPYVEALEKIRDLIDQLFSIGCPLKYLNLGGGLGIRYQDEEELDIDAYMVSISHYLQRWPLTLLLEPGRWLVGESGVLLTRVLYVKKMGVKTFVIVDAAMNDLLRPSLYDAYHEIEPVLPRPGPRTLVDIVGPVCESGDVLGRDRRLAPLVPGDLLSIRNAGAYGFSMAGNYNSRPRPAEVLHINGEIRLIRARESLEDLWRGEEF